MLTHTSYYYYNHKNAKNATDLNQNPGIYKQDKVWLANVWLPLRSLISSIQQSPQSSIRLWFGFGLLSDYAKKDKVVLLRDVGGVEQWRTVSIKEIQSGRRLEENLLLQPGDTIIVP